MVCFCKNVIDFLIIAFCIFVAVRILNKLKRNKPEEVTEAVEEDKRSETFNGNQRFVKRKRKDLKKSIMFLSLPVVLALKIRQKAF